MFRKKEKTETAGRTRPGTVVDEKMVKELRSKTMKDGHIVVDRNRWFAVSMVLAVIALIAMFMAIQANNRFANNVRVAWVKMYPNGTWDMEFHDEGRQPEFFTSTIDYLIRQWVERRFTEVAHSVKSDYGFALQFMAPKLANEFLDPSRFNAPQKAAEINECPICDETTITVRNIDHYDSDQTAFGRAEGTLYRTNVFVRETVKDGDGSVKGETNKIVSLHWRLKNKTEIQADKDLLKINPIGLEIIRADLLDDPAPIASK